MQQTQQPKWGFLREHSSIATGKDILTGLHRNGLDEYLAAIYPNTADWVHDKAFGVHSDGINHKLQKRFVEARGRI